MEVKFLDLSLSTRQIKDDYLRAVEKILDKANYILTEEVAEFEKAWADKIGVKYAVGVSCGTDALYLGLVSCDVGSGDEVITQGNAYNASVTAILRVGAIPRFVDINPKTLQMDVSKIESLISSKTKAILPVHLYGQANNMDMVCDLAKKYNLRVIEDCAQAHLAKFDNRFVGVWGDVGAFSFYPTKNLGAFGDAGVLTTNDESVYKKLLALRNLGQVGKNNHEYLGFNMRLDPLQAVCLSLKLPFLEENTKKRQEAAMFYDQLIKQSGILVEPIEQDQQATHVYHLYVVRVLNVDRDLFQQELLKIGVQTGVYYPVPVYNQPFYKWSHDPCPITDEVSRSIICLPLYESISRRTQEYVVSSIKNVITNL